MLQNWKYFPYQFEASLIVTSQFLSLMISTTKEQKASKLLLHLWWDHQTWQKIQAWDCSNIWDNYAAKFQESATRIRVQISSRTFFLRTGIETTGPSNEPAMDRRLLKYSNSHNTAIFSTKSRKLFRYGTFIVYLYNCNADIYVNHHCILSY